MIQKIVKSAVVAIILFVIYLIIAALVAQIPGMPALTLVLVGGLLMLAFILYLCRAFDINF